MLPMVLSAVSDIVCAVIFMAISLPLVFNKIPPNHYYGFRIGKAFASVENWYLINRYGGRALILWSVLLLVIGLVKLALAPGRPDLDPESWGALSTLAVTVLPLLFVTLAATVQTVRYASRL